MIKSILLPLDGSEYTESVLQYGKFLAQKFNSVLRIITVVDVRSYEWTMNVGSEGYMPVVPANVYHDESHKFLIERADDLVSRVSGAMQASKLRYDISKIEGAPADVIVDMSRQTDLIVMGARGDYARWGGAFLGATVESVSRQCSTPLLIVEKEFKPFEDLIIAYDKSENANKALKFAAKLAESLGLPLEVATVQNEEEFRNLCLTEAKNYLEPFKLDVRYRHEAGDASEMLISITKTVARPTVLLMGSYGHSRIREAILGSTTVQVMRGASKPILLMK